MPAVLPQEVYSTTMILRLIFLLLALPNLVAVTTNSSWCDDLGWSRVWADEFNTFKLDESSWTIDLEGGDSKVRDSQGTIDNVLLEDGDLVLRSQREVSGKYNFTSGAISGKGKRSWKATVKSPLRVCVRAKLPGDGGQGKGLGIWPAHWLMPDTNACWPTNGEIDIMEMINGDGTLHGTYHWAAACAQNHQKPGTTPVPAGWGATYHEYAVEFSPDRIRFVLDGRVYFTVNSSEATLYDVPYYAILNTAVGGPWPRPPSNTTTFPAYHRIDYFRVSRKAI